MEDNQELNDDELMEAARQAGFNYHKIYGVFPDNIYIDLLRLRDLQKTAIAFMKMKPAGAYSLLQTAPGGVSLDIHKSQLRPIIGYSKNDVYVSMPELPDNGYRSGEALYRMAKSEFDMKCK